METAQSHYAHNSLSQAESNFLLALELSPGLGEAHKMLGKINQTRKNYPVAIEHYKTAVRLQRCQPDIYIQLAFCQQKLNRTEMAIATYLELTSEYPDLPIAYLGLGVLYEIQNEKENAETAYSNYRALKH